MNGQPISLSEKSLNSLFPFYILINRNGQIDCSGVSLNKIASIQIGTFFHEIFKIIRPYIEFENFSDLEKLQQQLLFIEYKQDTSILLRGQFELLEATDQLLFVGSPWFYSMDEVREKKLTLSDFAIHDPLMDLLHVLKTAEMASDDLKQLVKTIDRQKKDLKQATKEMNDIALFPKQNPDPLIRINQEGEVLLMNPAAEKIEFLKYNDITYEKQELWAAISSQLNQNNSRLTIEAEFNQQIFSFIIIPIPEQGYYNIYGRDITDQKQQESEMRKLSLVADKTTNAVIMTDQNGLTEWVNAAFEKYTGYTLDEIKGSKPGQFLQGKDTDPDTIRKIGEMLKKEFSFSQEILNYTKAGKPYWVKMNFQPIFDKQGNLIKYFSIQDDITAQKKTREILERSEEKYRSIISNINLGLLEVDLNENIQMANQSFCVMSGYQQSELIGRNTKDLFTLESNTVILDEKRKLRTERVSDAYEMKVKNKFGETRYWLISGAPLLNDMGEQIGSIGIHLDITDRKEQERKMVKLLETLQIVNNELNDFAYIVSHDLKAPLRAIGSLATWLEADYSDKLDEEGKTTLSLIVQRTQRMHNLIDGILNYSKVGRDQSKITMVKTHELVLKIADMLSIPENIKLILEAELPDVQYEEIKLQQVFQNLMSNAIKFMDKPAGEIRISFIEQQHNFEFSVTDNGPGIDKVYHKKVFQIFQTLQARDKLESTGVGLSIVKKIVESYGGKISIDSEVGNGTTFTFSVLK